MNFNFATKLDIFLFIAVALLIFLGLSVMFSISHSSTGVDLLNFKKQLVFSLASIVILTSASFFDYRMLKNFTGIIYIMSCFVLITLLFYGYTVRETSSWFSFGIFNIQPSEFVKIVMVIILAKYFSQKSSSKDSKKIIVSAVYTAIPVFLILLQPDFGSALVIIFLWLSVLFVSGIRKKYILIIFIIGSLIFAAGWTYILKDYQKDRIITFINPQSDPLDSGYNVIQSITAVGSGGIWGKGLGHGSQSQLNFLPEKHTDFIFAVISEEMGFIGALFVITLFGIIFYRAFRIASKTQDNFGKLLVIGFSLVLIFHVFVNVGMNIGIMPITGIPLPFVSYGGSALISFSLMVSIIQSVHIKGRKYKLVEDEDAINYNQKIW